MAYIALFSVEGVTTLDPNSFLAAVVSSDGFIWDELAVSTASATNAASRDNQGADHNLDSLFFLDSAISLLSTGLFHVTAEGEIQVDFNGDGNNWVTIGTIESVQANGIVHSGGLGPVGVMIDHPDAGAAGGMASSGTHFLPWLMDDMGQTFVHTAQPFVI